MTGPDDKDLEKYLAGGSRVSRDYDALGQEQPPAGLDSRILAEAAAAVGVKKTRRRPPLWWLRPAALAATVLVSLSILLRVGEFPRLRPSAEVNTTAPLVQVEVLPPSVVAENEAPAAAPSWPPPGEFAAPEPPAQELAREQVAKRVLPADATSAVTLMSQERKAEIKEMPPRSTPSFTPKAVERAMVAIRLRLGEPAAHANGQMSSLARLPEAGVVGKTEAGNAAADARLREILALYDDGNLEVASAGLADFARDFPADPLTLSLTSSPE